MIKVAQYTIRIMGPDATTYENVGEKEKEIEASISSIDWGNVTDVINDELPDGFYVKIDE